jgi:pyruvate-ferredoxin/flavodoxin oxidoreductase
MPRSSAAATACRPRNSPRPWSRRLRRTEKAAKPKNHFTVGIIDDVTTDQPGRTTPPSSPRGRRGAGHVLRPGRRRHGGRQQELHQDHRRGHGVLHAQGYFVYDSKKSGSQTVSHLRFGPEPIRSTYLIQSANFIGCHQFNFLEKTDVLKLAAPGRRLPAELPVRPRSGLGHLPTRVQEQIIAKKLKFYVIDGYKVGRDTGMGNRINTIMQTCFFAISGVLPREDAIAKIKYSIQKTYGKKGEEVVQKNFQAVDHTLANLYEVKVPAAVTQRPAMPPVVPAEAPEFVQKTTSFMMAGLGDDLPVSADAGGRHLPDRHDQVGEAQHLAERAGVGFPSCAPSAACAAWSAPTA